jgi:hypothetical protein
MSYILRRQRVAYDNIAIGSAMTRPNIVAAVDPPNELPFANNIKLADGETSHMDCSTEPSSVTMNSIITQAGGRTTLDPQERMAVASS